MTVRNADTDTIAAATRSAVPHFAAIITEARAEMSHEDIRRAISDALGNLGEDENGWRAWARDVFDDNVVYEWGGKLWRSGYTLSEDGTAELGEGVEVVVTYTPVGGTSEAAEAIARAEANSLRESMVKALEQSEPLRAEMRVLLERLDNPTGLVDLVESNPTPIAERAVRTDGTALIKLIEPGWGSTGYYSPAVLERDVPQVFPAGTKMFWDHPTDREARERPEGSLERLAAELVETPTYLKGSAAPAGEGVYAKAKVFEKYAGLVDDLAPHIGVSIRGRGRTKVGTAEGRNGPIVDELTEGISTDFVTMPGAGGRIVEMFEAARRPLDNPEGEGSNMDELTEARRRADEAEAKITEAETKAREAAERAERAELAVAVATAGTKAREALASVKLPDAAKDRIVERLASNPPTKDGQLDVEALEAAAKDAAEAERKYLAGIVGSGRVTGLGESDDAAPTADGELSEADQKAIDKEYESLASTIGLDEAATKTFVTGRS